MKKAKKLVSLLLVVLMSLTLWACAPSKPASPQPTDSKPEASQPAAESTKEAKPVDYPNRSIKLICPWSPGGSSDAMCRNISTLSKDYFGQEIVVVNREGAGGTIATAEAANAKADGYTIIFENVGVFTCQPNFREVAYKIEDFTPVVGLTYEPIVLVANANSKYKTLDDIKNATETIKFCGVADGSLTHISGMALFNEMGTDVQHIPYDGSGPALAALLGGHIDFLAAHPGEVTQYLEEKSLVAIGVFSPERPESIPEVPTFKEQGYDLDFSVWSSLLVPKDTSPEIVSYLQDTILKMMEDPKFKDFTTKTNITMQPLKGAQVAEKFKNEIKATGDVIKGLGITLN